MRGSDTSTSRVHATGSSGWDVVAPGAQRGEFSSRHAASRDRFAREIVQNEGGGEVVIHDRRGLIRDSDTVAPGAIRTRSGTNGSHQGGHHGTRRIRPDQLL